MQVQLEDCGLESYVRFDWVAVPSGACDQTGGKGSLRNDLGITTQTKGHPPSTHRCISTSKFLEDVMYFFATSLMEKRLRNEAWLQKTERSPLRPSNVPGNPGETRAVGLKPGAQKTGCACSLHLGHPLASDLCACSLCPSCHSLPSLWPWCSPRRPLQAPSVPRLLPNLGFLWRVEPRFMTSVIHCGLFASSSGLFRFLQGLGGGQ